LFVRSEFGALARYGEIVWRVCRVPGPLFATRNLLTRGFYLGRGTVCNESRALCLKGPWALS